MQYPKWKNRSAPTDDQKILMVYRLPKDNECIIFFKNPKSTLTRQGQLEHLRKSLKILEEVWKEYKNEKIDGSHEIQYENDDGTPSTRTDSIDTVLKRIDAAGKMVDFKNFASEFIKGDGYLSYIPIVQKSFLKQGETTLI